MGNGTIAPTFFTDAAVKPFNPVPSAPAGPPPQKQQQAGGSPIHDFVVKNPTASPEQVQAQFPAISLDGIKAILPGVKQDVLKTWVPPVPAPQGPPPNAVQQAMAPIAPPPPSAPSGMPLNAFTAPGAPGYEPMGKPQAFPQAVSNTPPPPQTAPVAPGPPPDAMAARQATLAGIPGYVPGAYAPPGPGGVGMQSGPPMQDGGGHGGNSFLDGLKRFAPALALALATKNNPQVGASILGGINSAQQRMAAEKAQEDAIKRQQAQLDTENTQKQGELAQKFRDGLTKLSDEGQQHAVESLTPEQAKAMGIDKTSFYDASGKFRPVTAAEKQYNPATAIKGFQSLTPEAQQHVHDAMPKDQFESTYGIPYDNFQPLTTTAGETAAGRAATQADTAYSNAHDKLFKDLTSLDNTPAGLQTQRSLIAGFNQTWKGKGAYVKMPGEDGTPGFGGLDPVKAADIALKGAQTKHTDKATSLMDDELLIKQGNLHVARANVNERIRHDKADEGLAGINATTAQVRANNDANYKAWQASKSTDGSGKSLYGSPWGKVYDDAVKLRDTASSKLTAWRNQKDGDGNIVNKGKADPSDLVEPIVRLDGQIERMNATNPPREGQDARTWQYTSGGVVGGPPAGKGTQKGDAVPVVPSVLGPKIDATAVAMQKDGRANQPHYCERVARQTYQQNTNAYNKYWAGSAKTTAQNFINAGIAKPYKPGMPVPAGSLLYSTEKMGGGDGHVQVVGNNGNRYDQHGVNQFSPSNFNWYVPPPGGASYTTAKSGPPPTQKTTSTPVAMKPIGNGITLNTKTGEYFKNGQATGHFRG